MDRETPSKTKGYRAELQVCNQGRAVEKPWVCAAVGSSRGAAGPVSQPQWWAENPLMPNASAAELLRERLGKAGGRLEPERQTFEVERIFPPFYKEKGRNAQRESAREGEQSTTGEEGRYLFPKHLCLRKWHQEHMSN